MCTTFVKLKEFIKLELNNGYKGIVTVKIINIFVQTKKKYKLCKRKQKDYWSFIVRSLRSIKCKTPNKEIKK